MNRLAPVLPRERQQAAVQIGRRCERHVAAAVARHRRTRPVGRQLKLLGQPLQAPRASTRAARQCAGAVALVAQQLTLPQRVVRVLHRQRRKRRQAVPGSAPRTAPRGPAPAARATSRRRRCGAAQQQHMLVRPATQTDAPAAEARRQVEARASRGRQRLRKLRLGDLRRSSSRTGRPRSQDLLTRHPDASGYDRPQALVTIDQVGERPSSAARSSAPASRTASGIT